MFKWIIKNKEWLFSGVGLLLIIFIADQVNQNINKKNNIVPENNISVAGIEPIIDPSVTPSYIYDLIDKAPVLQRETITNSMIGITVRWEGELRRSTTSLSNKCQLMILLNEMGRHYFAIFNIDPKIYPGLNLLTKGHRIKFEGKIEKINNDIFWLYNVKIFFTLHN